jgi:hypothetical protein
MASVTTSVSESRPRHIWRWLIMLFLAPIIFWYFATPQVNFYFSEKGQGRLGYILNVQHDISKGEIYPGEVTGGPGHIFPDKKFFMEFDWSNGGKSHCIRVKPTWPNTDIYIGPQGEIDSRTDSRRIEPCGPLPKG